MCVSQPVQGPSSCDVIIIIIVKSVGSYTSQQSSSYAKTEVAFSAM